MLYTHWDTHDTLIYVCAILSAVSSIFSAAICMVYLVHERLHEASENHAWLRKTAHFFKFLKSKRWHPTFRTFISLQQLLYYIISVASLYNFVRFKSGGAVLANRWSIGQIIAVTIWAPVICKYIYKSICKFRTLL